MASSTTLVFYIVVLAMTAIYCTGWPGQQDNPDINVFKERRLAKREFQHPLFGEVDAILRLPRAVVPARHPIEEPDIPEEPYNNRPRPYKAPATKPACRCPCGPGAYSSCDSGCDKGSCYDCPCPCGYRGNPCPIGCRVRAPNNCGG